MRQLRFDDDVLHLTEPSIPNARAALPPAKRIDLCLEPVGRRVGLNVNIAVVVKQVHAAIGPALLILIPSSTSPPATFLVAFIC